MRHAKSSWSDPFHEDAERPLNKRGFQAAAAMGRWLRRKAYLPDQALVSTSVRTRQTFDRLRLETVPHYQDALYHASAETLLSHLRAATGQVVLLIAHNPGIGDAAGRLVNGPVRHARFADYPTCATLVVDFPGSWGEVSWGAGAVQDFLTPHDLA